MSADNGIYILRSPMAGKPDQFEYRVAHCQAIENIQPNSEFGNSHEFYQVLLFGKSPVWFNKDEAWQEAHRQETEVLASEFPVLEYGCCEIAVLNPFPTLTQDQAEEKLDEFWGKYKRPALV